jgi:glycerol-3-phosphate dehydrogenase
MRILVVLLALLGANAAFANCPRPGAAPEVPDGSVADEAAMKQGRETIQAYVDQLEAYKACLQTQVDQASSDTTDEQKITWLAQGDAALDAANLLANRYSLALKAFKERSSKSAN